MLDQYGAEKLADYGETEGDPRSTQPLLCSMMLQHETALQQLNASVRNDAGV